ncbi:hypothetical protein D3C72_1975390 [compost metagenome]
MARCFRPHRSAIALGGINDGGNADQVGSMRTRFQHGFGAVDQCVYPASLARAGFAFGDIDPRGKSHCRAFRKIGGKVRRCAQFGNRGRIGVRKQWNARFALRGVALGQRGEVLLQHVRRRLPDLRQPDPR